MSTTYELTRCLVCAESDARELASAEEMHAEVETLWAFHSRRLRADIPPDHLMDRVAFSQRSPLRVVQCRHCGLVYRNPIERAAELATIYEEEGPAPDVLRALHETQRGAYAAQAARLTRVFGRRGTGIEVGSYVGAFLSAARDAGWQFSGVDVNAAANRFTRSLGFQVHDGPIESLDAERRADVVAIWNCLDQLADPAAAIRAAHGHLAAGGMLAVRVPNGACYAAMRERMGGPRPFSAMAREWLAQNNLLGFPYRYGFTPGALAQLVTRLGFRVEHVMGDVLVPIADRWTRPWAAVEERAVKGAIRLAARAARGERTLAPWFELYARVP
jgi:SAM-dependent methyltransferase